MSHAVWGDSQALLERMKRARVSLPSTESGTGERHASAPSLQIPEDANHFDFEGRTIETVFSFRAPQIMLLRGVLSQQECEAAVQSATKSLERSRVLDGEKEGDVLSDVRTSFNTFLRRDADSSCAAIEGRLHRMFHWPLPQGEGLQIVRYDVGQEYKPHYDFFVKGTHAERTSPQRVATVICYLNSPDQGGHTSFPDLGLSVVPREGDALFFVYETPTPTNRTLHAGMPVTRGVKWIATKWFTQAVE